MATKSSSSIFLIILIVIIIMVVLFLSIIGFLIYRYHKNQRQYLKTLTRTIYDTLQKSSYNGPTTSSHLQINPSGSISGSHHNPYSVAYVYK